MFVTMHVGAHKNGSSVTQEAQTEFTRYGRRLQPKEDIRRHIQFGTQVEHIVMHVA